MNASTPADSAASPIADLTYRNYDGPLHTRAVRWWIIAAAMFKLHTKPLSFKILGALSVIPYLFIIVILWFQGQLNTRPNGAQIVQGLASYMDNTPGQKFAIQFYNALGYQLLFLLILTLIAGSGSIAADNRSSALLIYLSKPVTKTDYLIGKWVGLFLSLFTVAFAPSLMLYLYCLLSFMGDGFLHQEPRLFVHMLASVSIACAVFTSAMIGLSAWSKSPRIVGAILAGFYFASQTVAVALWLSLSNGNYTRYSIALHSSIGGAISGLSQGIYGVTIHATHLRRKTMEIVGVNIAPPPQAVMWGIVIGIIVAGIVAARAKIRAVEVIA